MNSLLIGSTGFIGTALRQKLIAAGPCSWTTRNGLEKDAFMFDLTGLIKLPPAEVIYLVAGKGSFRSSELDPDAYLVNVDGPIRVAAHFKNSFIVFLSSEAAEWSQSPLGMQKRSAELGLLAVCGYERLAIVRPAKITDKTVGALCDDLVNIGEYKLYGVHRPRYGSA